MSRGTTEESRSDTEPRQARPDLPPVGRLDFFQAVFLLERLLGSADEQARRVGRDTHPSDEPVRFRSEPSLRFAARAVARIETGRNRDGGETAEVWAAFMGLAGRNTPLPPPYAKEVIRQNRARNTALHDFLDLLSHRLVSLFYRARLKHAPLQSVYDDLVGRRTVSPLLQAMLAFTGYGDATVRRRTGLPDWIFLKYVGLWANRTRPAAGLSIMLADLLGVSARIEEFRGTRVTLDADERRALGSHGRNPGDARLSRRAMLGECVFRPDASFRIRLGPMSLRQFTALLPDRPAIRQARALAQCYTRAETDFDIQLVLRGSEAPGCRLGDGSEGGSRLGWTSWLAGDTMDVELADAIFSSGGEG
ncbi:MAG: type VI secretion system baseplate subunit TssG [Alphaproteobacteria bacterium]|nr:type VI secretion system baseplate subunit TssG [Alphaproteobacteria bacterium]